MHFSPEIRQQLKITANARGQIVYDESQGLVEPMNGGTLIGIWDIENNTPGSLYVAEELPKTSQLAIKHSSFNGNQAVMAAWNMTTDYGYITEINDGSGHYMPLPLHMFLLVQRLRDEGIDLTSTYIHFWHGIEFVRGLRILALDFIRAVEVLRPEELMALTELRGHRKNFNIFLKLIFLNTDDALSKATIAIYQVRSSDTLNENTIRHIAHFFNDLETTEDQIIDSLKGLFNSKHLKFKDKSSIRFRSQETQDLYYAELKRLLQKYVTRASSKQVIESWFAAR